MPVVPIDAQILSGPIVNYPESSPPPALTFGDGIHSVTLWWSVNNLNSSGFFYGTSGTEVAVATGVSKLSQISDASIFSFTTSPPTSTPPVFDVRSTGGLGSFLVLRNTLSGYYGVVRVDDIFAYATPIDHGGFKSYSGLNATWWFQSDGTGNFTTVPEPSISVLFFAAAGALVLHVRMRTRGRCLAKQASH